MQLDKLENWIIALGVVVMCPHSCK